MPPTRLDEEGLSISVPTKGKRGIGEDDSALHTTYNAKIGICNTESLCFGYNTMGTLLPEGLVA